MKNKLSMRKKAQTSSYAKVEKEDFWSIIQRAEKNPKKLKIILSRMSIEDVVEFENTFFQYSNVIRDGKSGEVLEEVREASGDFSDYCSWAAVWAGREIYRKCVRDPDFYVDFCGGEESDSELEDLAEKLISIVQSFTEEEKERKSQEEEWDKDIYRTKLLDNGWEVSLSGFKMKSPEEEYKEYQEFPAGTMFYHIYIYKKEFYGEVLGDELWAKDYLEDPIDNLTYKAEIEEKWEETLIKVQEEDPPGYIAEFLDEVESKVNIKHLDPIESYEKTLEEYLRGPWRSLTELDPELVNILIIQLKKRGINISGDILSTEGKYIITNKLSMRKKAVDVWEENNDEEEKKEEWKEEKSKKLLKERIREEMVVPSKEPISKTLFVEELKKRTPELLNKYTTDQIFDIAAGRKTDVTAEEVEQAKDVITRGIVANKLNMRKTAQSTLETIQKAQTGDEDAIAQVIEENMGLISQALINWGYVPRSDEFEDVMSDIKVEMLNKIIPRYDPSRGAFSTFLSTAVSNYLKNLPTRKEYKGREKEISMETPISEDITLGETLEDPTSKVVQMTLSSARENLQIWLHMKNPELEDIVLRIFDLKIEDYSHGQIAGVLNKEGYTSKGKSITRNMVSNYFRSFVKPALAQFFEAFKTASLNMRKRADTAPLSYKKVMDLSMIIKDLQQVGDLVMDIDDVEELEESLYNVFGNDILFNKILDYRREKTTTYDIIRIIGEHLTTLDKDELKPYAREIFESLIRICQDPGAPRHQIEKVPLKEVFKIEKEKEEEEKEEWKEEEPKKPLKERIREEMVVPSKEPVSKTPYTEVVEKYTPEILQRYTTDQIFDIAAGRKTDVTKEEIEMAKDVIQRGIVANRLSMRKKGK